MQQITIIGSGQMGNGIAHVFAQSGYDVTIIDIRQEALDQAITTIGKNMERQVAKGMISEEEKNRALQRIKTTTAFDKGVSTADLVVEAATENIDLKLKYFQTWTGIQKRNVFWPQIHRPYPSQGLLLQRNAATKSLECIS
jgi:3-hydroxybutyryl-CoA dehydrogenase